MSTVMNKTQALRAFKLLMERKVPEGHEYCVVVYMLLDKVEDGKHGLWLCAGTYSTAEKAKKAAKEIIIETGITSVIATKCCQWEFLNEESDPDRIKWVASDKEAKYRLKAEKEYQKQVEAAKKQQKINRIIEEERERETDPSSIEHYTTNWYNAILNYSRLQYEKNKIKEIEQSFNERVSKIRKQYNVQPEYEERWLSKLKERLIETEEQDKYLMIESCAEKIKSIVLPSDNN